MRLTTGCFLGELEFVHWDGRLGSCKLEKSVDGVAKTGSDRGRGWCLSLRFQDLVCGFILLLWSRGKLVPFQGSGEVK